MTNIRSLSVKLISSLLLILFATLTLGFFYFSKSERRENMENILKQAAQNSSIVMASIEGFMKQDAETRKHLKGTYHTLGIINTLTSTKLVDHLVVTDSTGKITITSLPQEKGLYLEEGKEICDRCHHQEGSVRQIGFTHVKDDGKKILRSVIPIFNQPRCDSCHQGKVIGLMVNDMLIAEMISHEKAQIRRYAYLSLSIFLVMTLSIFLISSRTIKRPIKSLMKGTEEMALGNYDVKIPAKSMDELGILANSFNNMAEKVKAARSVLEGWKETLEKEVDQRTKELKAAFKQLESEKNKSDSIAHSLVEGVLSLGPDGKVVLANQQAAEIFGQKEDRLMGKTIEQILKESSWQFQNPAELEKMMVVDARKVDGCPGEIQQIQPRRQTYKLCCSRIRGREGEDFGWVYSFHNISREREIDEIKTNLVAIVSHELRTPLTAIKGALSLMADDRAMGKKELKEFQHIALTNTDRLIGLINNLLDMAKIESGTLFCDHGTFFIRPLIERCLDAISSSAARNRTRFSIDVPENITELFGDAAKIEQVIVNLLSNAIKFSPKGGKVSISAVRKEEEFVVSISDNGIGIPDEEKETIFDKFYQVDMSSIRRAGGSGLGLSICKAIVEGHGGRIWVESKKGEGSAFYFTLPMMRKEEKSISELPAPEPVLPIRKISNRVLVVEDEKDVRKILCKYLQERGVEVIEASTAKEALRLARQKSPDCITIDVMLPDIDGFDLTTVLKNDPSTRDIPIIFLTVVEGDGESRGMQLGAAAYFKKPAKYEKVVEKIESLISSIGMGKRKGRILLVDDEEDIVRLLGKFLSKKGYEVTSAMSGKEALKVLEKSIPDIIILDLRMPGVSGYEVLRKVKTDPRCSHLPVIVMTAHGEEYSRNSIIEMGASLFLQKPLSPEFLHDEIKKIIH